MLPVAVFTSSACGFHSRRALDAEALIENVCENRKFSPLKFVFCWDVEAVACKANRLDTVAATVEAADVKVHTLWTAFWH
jgi:hypothetical protein